MPRLLRRRLLVITGLLAALLGVAAATSAVLWWSVASSFDDGRAAIPSAQAFPDASTRPSVPAGAGSAQNILLLGSDTRGPAPRSLAAIRAQRSDSMLLLHLPADGRHVTLISIMRDSWVPIPGHGMGKINAAFSYGGVPLTVQVVERLLDVRVDHVVVVSFSGFEGMTDALGGVTVANAVAFDSDGQHFAKGRVALHGQRALAYVRARYPFADGDYQRVRNQRAYLTAVAEKLLSRGVLLDPGRTRATVAAIAPYLLVDDGLDSRYLAERALALRGFRPADLTSFTIPTTGTATEAGQSVVLLDDDGVADLGRHLRNDAMDTFEGCSLRVC